MKKEMLLIDGHGLAFRGFYALPETLSAPDGTPTNAILGFTNMLVKCLDEWQPDGVGLFFDPIGRTTRHDLFDAYKQNRKPTPEIFKTQMPLIIEISRALGIPVLIRDGVEADDYIVSTAKKAAEGGWRVKILSADKDLFQIIDDDISVVRPSRGISEFISYDTPHFEKTYGFAPSLMVDYLSLVGDAADNIPGVPGIGEKSAKELIHSYGSLDKIYEHLRDIPMGKRTKLEAGKEMALMSRTLIVPQETEPADLDTLQIGDPDEAVLKPLLERLALKKLLERMGHKASAKSKKEQDTSASAEVKYDYSYDPAAFKECALPDVLASQELALVHATDEIFLVTRDENYAVFDPADDVQAGQWAAWCETGVLTIYGLRELLARYEIALPPLSKIRDIEVLHYLLHPDRGGAIEITIGYPLSEGPGQGRQLFALYERFMPNIEKYGLERLMEELDMPLCRTLAKLKKKGILVDRARLEALEKELESELEKTEQVLAEVAGEKINLNSPKQVGYLLFEQLNLPAIKKTKTGYSTDASVLEELAKLPKPLSDVPNMILSYREHAKILSGYVQPFLKVTEHSERVHSTFDHLATGTGRLSSYEPNVQNMPVFGEIASKFRDCFIPGEGRVFVAADYSQIELRVLAHLSGEKKLVEAFVTGRDIHMETASWVFDLPAEDIMPEQRRFAKVVNFGLLYGMGAFGLSQRLGIPRLQATTMIEKYFSIFPGVRAYLDSSMLEARDRGYTRSIFGRIRPLDEVATTEGRGGGAIDRVAVNTPIQSAASDIAKIALLRFSDVAEKEFEGAYPMLQVHDSIVCECAEKDADRVEKRLVEVMESVNVLSVPVVVEAKRGKTLSGV